MAPELFASAATRRVVFVYFKIRRSQVKQLKSAFAAAGAAPMAARVQLLRRADASEATDAGPGDLQTWMEIHWLPETPTNLAGSWDVEDARRQIEAWALAAGLAGIIQGQRHFEAFETCA